MRMLEMSMLTLKEICKTNQEIAKLINKKPNHAWPIKILITIY